MEPLSMHSPSVCFVAQELPQFVKNGGAGTATLGFAEALADSGCIVSILYISPIEFTDVYIDECIKSLSRRGIDLYVLERELGKQNFHYRYGNLHYDIMVWLRHRIVDVLHFYDFGGFAFYVTQAKLSGVAFQDTIINIFMHGSTRWAADITELFFDHGGLEVDFLERSSMAAADTIMSPSNYMFDYIDKTGLILPERRFIQRGVLPTLVPAPSESFIAAPRAFSEGITEIIFFGRHEIRKGFILFVDAMARILAEDESIHVTFLGKHGTIYGVDSQYFAETRLAKFTDRIEFFSPAEREKLIGRLTAPGALAVIPSIDENLPNTVFESVLWGINFIASDVGGIHELLDPKTASKRLFNPAIEDLISKIKEMGKEPAEPAVLSFDPQSERQKFIDWHFEMQSRPIEIADEDLDPLVTVCVIHYERPVFLRQALNSLISQTYKNLEIIVVDDGSSSSDTIGTLKRLESEFSRYGVRFLKTPDIGLGPARNFGVNNSSGKYIFFLDDDNLACPDMIESFTRAALVSRADVITGMAYVFTSQGVPTDEMKTYPHWLPLGGAVNLGMFNNRFGDAQSLWLKSTFNKLGGFVEARIPSEDWELFSRASLCGYKIIVIPRQLHWRRKHLQSLSFRPYSQWKNYTQIAENYAKHPPADLNLILRVAQRNVAFAGGPLLDPYAELAAAQEAQFGISLGTAGSSESQIIENKAELLPRPVPIGSSIRLGEMELAVLAGAAHAPALIFQRDQWSDCGQKFSAPKNFFDGIFRAFIVVDCLKPTFLRFAFLTDDFEASQELGDIDHNTADPANVAEIWRHFEPGATCIYFSRFDCATLRGKPDFSCVKEIFFGGSPGDATVRVSLSFIHDGSVIDVM